MEQLLWSAASSLDYLTLITLIMTACITQTGYNQSILLVDN